MGTLKKPNKVYFLKTDPNCDDVYFFNSFSQLQSFIEECLWEGEQMNDWQIWSAVESDYKTPIVTRGVKIEE